MKFPCGLLVIGVVDKVADSAARLACGNGVNRELPAIDSYVGSLTVRYVDYVEAGQVCVDIVALGASAAADIFAEAGVAPDDVALFARNDNGIFILFKKFGIKSRNALRRTADGSANVASELK